MADAASTHSRSATLVGLVAALGGPPAFVLVSQSLIGREPSLGVQITAHLVYCALAAVLIWRLLWAEQQPIESLGLKAPTLSTALTAIVAAIAALFLLPFIQAPVLAWLGDEGLAEGLRELRPLPDWFRLAVAVTGGPIEETLYRGYATSRLVTLTSSRGIGGTLGAVAFGLAHVPAWGLGYSLAADLPFGILMTALFLWRRDLFANALAHGAVLVIGLLRL